MADISHVKALLDKPEPPAMEDETALAPIYHGPFTLTSSGLKVEGNPTIEQWAEVGQILAVMDRALAFLVGDWIRFGEDRYGEMAAQFIDARQWQPETVRNYVWLAERVPQPNRMLDRGLTIRHHQLVAKLPPAEQGRWLRRALNDGGQRWTPNMLRAAIRGNDETASDTEWYVVVPFENEGSRDKFVDELRMRGLAYHAGERTRKKGA